MNEVASARELALALVEAYNAKDYDRMRALYSDDVVLDDPAFGQHRVGIEAVLGASRAAAEKGVPDRRFSLRRVIAAGDIAVLELGWDATPVGAAPRSETWGLEPGSAVHLEVCRVVETREGRICRIVDYAVRPRAAS